MVFINGQLVIQDGQVLTVNEQEVLAEFVDLSTTLRRIFLGLSVSHRQKPIEAVDRIELDLSLEDESSIPYVICKGERKYPFGSALNRAEQVWLAREISNHLKKLKS